MKLLHKGRAEMTV